jgi:hypothetical protein
MLAAWIAFACIVASAPETEAEREAARAIAAWQAKAYAKAAASFLRAWELSKEPTQLRNAAKALEAAGAPDEARKRWSELLTVRGLDPTDRAEATARLEALARASPKPAHTIEDRPPARVAPKSYRPPSRSKAARDPIETARPARKMDAPRSPAARAEFETALPQDARETTRLSRRLEGDPTRSPAARDVSETEVAARRDSSDRLDSRASDDAPRGRLENDPLRSRASNESPRGPRVGNDPSRPRDDGSSGQRGNDRPRLRDDGSSGQRVATDPLRSRASDEAPRGPRRGNDPIRARPPNDAIAPARPLDQRSLATNDALDPSRPGERSRVSDGLVAPQEPRDPNDSGDSIAAVHSLAIDPVDASSVPATASLVATPVISVEVDPGPGWPPWVLMAVGALSVGVSVALWIVQAGELAELERALAVGEGELVAGLSYDEAVARRGRVGALRAGGGVTLGVGVAALAGGIAWWLW